MGPELTSMCLPSVWCYCSPTKCPELTYGMCYAKYGTDIGVWRYQAARERLLKEVEDARYATPCPRMVLRYIRYWHSVCFSAMSGTGVVYGAAGVCGTDTAYDAARERGREAEREEKSAKEEVAPYPIVLRIRYAMSGTGIVHACRAAYLLCDIQYRHLL
eukprot:3177848-Rhodomonas_salina.3